MSEPRDDGRGDYLWDGSGPSDPEVRALEELLRPLGHDGRPLDIARLRRGPARVFRRWPWIVGLVAAAGIVAALWLRSPGDGELQPGAAPRQFVVGAEARTLRLGELAEVTVLPGSQLELLHWRTDEARFLLRTGGIDVRVAPPPAVQSRFFCVDTKAGSVVDLGCKYELRVRPDGSEHVRVTEGEVEFAYPRRTVHVPASAECTFAGGWPNTPTFKETDRRLRDMVGKFDSVARAGNGDRFELAKEIAGRCEQGRDSLILWHLMRDDEPSIRRLAEDRLLALEGPPPGADEKVSKGEPVHAEPEIWLPFLREVWNRGR